MRPNHSVLRSALLLTLVELLLRGISMLFQRYLALAVGAEGVGLMQLILSVGSLAMTFGLSGLRVGAMYLCAEEYGRRRLGGIRQAMGCCLRAGAVCAALAGSVLWALSGYAAARWIGNAQVAPALRLLALFLPVNCLCAILSGFFTACDRVGELARVETVERLGSLALTWALLSAKPGLGAQEACTRIVLGSSIACAGSTLWQLGMYRRTCRAFPPAPNEGGMGGRVLKLCAPLALSAYLRAGLSTLEQFLIPWGLAQSGASAERSMAAFGTIHGMVFPVLMFPAAILYTLADLLVPELARCRAEENRGRIGHLTKTCLRMGLLFSLSVGAIMGANAQEVAWLIYKSREAGQYLLAFSPMVVMLYMDAMTDGMLKGLGEQVACVRYNTLTSLMDVLLLYFLLPRAGVAAYIGVFLFVHAVNFLLSLRRLLKITGRSISGAFFLRALFCALAGLGACFCMPDLSGVAAILLRAGMYLLVFSLMLDLTGAFTGEDRRWLCHALGGGR